MAFYSCFLVCLFFSSHFSFDFAPIRRRKNTATTILKIDCVGESYRLIENIPASNREVTAEEKKSSNNIKKTWHEKKK